MSVKNKITIKKDDIKKFLQINLGLIICAIGVSCFYGQQAL